MISIETVLVVWVFVMAICLGSFLNVVILRGFSGESIVLPPSKCPHCSHKLAPWDNIPVLSFLALRGKCRYCKEKISFQYPLVELFTALTVTGIYLKFGFSLNTLFLTAAAALCIVMAVCDIKERIIFDTHAYILGVLGLIYNFFNIAGTNHTKITFFLAGIKLTIWQSFIYALLGLVAGIIIMEALARIPQIFIGKRAFGEGDTYIAGALGAFFGISNLIVIILFSLIFQVLIILPMFLYKLFKQKNYRLFSALILFLLLFVLIALGNFYDVLGEGWLYWFAIALLASIGYYCCRGILTGIKDGNGLTYLPFGPALILGAFVVIFFAGI